mmetsp:Transcript_12823/g.25059  ORF Transcript_12823/g.25059 Transcript_12823/m.25059 type:complete len:80 (-) Transcript_12823:421-660(-)
MHDPLSHSFIKSLRAGGREREQPSHPKQVSTSSLPPSLHCITPRESSATSCDSLVYSLTHSLIYVFTDSCTCPITHSLT